jgi:antitoxin HigA-1
MLIHRLYIHWNLCALMTITGDTALRLGHFFGTSAEFWLNLQKLYELRVAEQESGALIRTLPRLRGRAA